MTDTELTPRQIKMMKHALGIDYAQGRKFTCKPGECYEAFRNYYSAGKAISEWERLVKDGLATAEPDDGGFIYRVTEKGASALSEIFDTKITL